MKKLILGFVALLALIAFSTTTVTADDTTPTKCGSDKPSKCGSSKPKPDGPDVMCGRS